jgi:hypothetical protein
MKFLLYLIKYIIPNICFVFSLFLITCFIFDRFNRAMAVMNNEFTKISVLILSVLIVVEFILFIIYCLIKNKNDQN